MGVLEYRVNWGSGATNPGVSVLHARIAGTSSAGAAATSFSERCRKFFDDIKGVVGGGIVWGFPGEVTELNTATGALEAVHVVTPPANVTSTGAGVYAAPAGIRVEWRTDAIVGGRRLRGRTFVVPLITSGYDTGGTIASSTLTTMASATSNYLSTVVFTSANPSVWSRTHGVQADITSAFLPDEVAVLRSRRD